MIDTLSSSGFAVSSVGFSDRYGPHDVCLLRRAGEIIQEIKRNAVPLDDLVMEFLTIAKQVIPSLPTDLPSEIFGIGLNRSLHYCYELNDQLQRGAPLHEIESSIKSFLQQKNRIARCIELYQRIKSLLRYYSDSGSKDTEEIEKLLKRFFVFFSEVCPMDISQIEILSIEDQIELVEQLRMRVFSETNDEISRYLTKVFDAGPILHSCHVEPQQLPKSAPILDFIKETAKPLS